jgi:hypothetical protein
MQVKIFSVAFFIATPAEGLKVGMRWSWFPVRMPVSRVDLMAY